MKIILIAAMASNRVIGDRNTIPWMGKFPGDMRHFRNTTQEPGAAVLMGRKTWESIGRRALPHRVNYVLTRDARYEPQGQAIVVPGIGSAFDRALRDGVEKLFVIGGEQIYAQALRSAQEVILTVIERPYVGDTKFPELDSACWQCWGVESHEEGDQGAHPYRFEYWRRKKDEAQSWRS